MWTPSGIVTLTTDFGLTDPYVGVMKGVLLGIQPQARLVDLSHGIPPADILTGSRILQEARSFFPPGTVHLGVVDPGVGGPRRPILLWAGAQVFVGPDNGLFWPILRRHPDARVVHLTKGEYFLRNVSGTFHGRDVFAPVAARVSGGMDPLAMGEIVRDLVPLEDPLVLVEGDVLRGTVLRADRFGNLLTNIGRSDLEAFLEGASPAIRAGEFQVFGLSERYEDVPPGSPLALIGSFGHLELAVNRGNAATLFRFGGGALEVRISRDRGAGVSEFPC